MFFRSVSTVFFTLCLSVCTATSALARTIQNDQDIEEVTITASKIEQPLREVGSSVSVLTAEDLDAKAYLPIADILRTLPSVRASNSGGLGKNTAVRIRGEEGYKTLLLIDGIDVSDTTAPQIGPRFDHLLNSNFGRVEVLRGPQGLIYGADAAGVISIFSKRATEVVEGDLNLEVGEYSSKSASANVRGKHKYAHYSLSGNKTNSDGFNAREDDITEFDDDGYDNTTIHFIGGVTPSENTGIDLVYRRNDGEAEFDNCDYFADTFIQADDCLTNYLNTSGRINAYYNGEIFSHDLSYSSSKTKNKSIGTQSNNTSSDNNGKITRLQYTGNKAFINESSLTYGLESKKEEYQNLLFGGEYERDQIGAYIETQAKANDNFFFTVGARIDDNEDFDSHFSLRLSSAYLLTFNQAELKIKSAIGNGFRAPSLFETFSTQNGDTLLKEENSLGYEFGFEYTDQDFHSEITFFLSQIDDQIYYDNQTFEYLQSPGETQSKGVDIDFTYFATTNLKLAGNYTFNDTDYDENAGERTTRARRPQNSLNLSIDYAIFNQMFLIAANYRRVSNAIDYDFFDTPIPLDDYQTVDLTVTWSINDSVKTYIRAINLLETEYQEVPNYNTDEGSVYLGLRLSI